MMSKTHKQSFISGLKNTGNVITEKLESDNKECRQSFRGSFAQSTKAEMEKGQRDKRIRSSTETFGLSSGTGAKEM